MVFNLKLVTQPDVVDKNGRVYSKEAYKECEDQILQRLKHGTLYVSDGNGNFAGNITQPTVSHIIGKVINKYDDSIDVDITNEAVASCLKGYADNFKIGMNYFGRVNLGTDNIAHISDMKFGSYYLLDKNGIAFNCLGKKY